MNYIAHRGRFQSLVFIGIFLVMVGLVARVQAQEALPSPAPEDEAGLAFPIAELGDCSDMGTCLSYCEDPVNHAACVSFAQQKGFYEDDPTLAPTDEFWTETQSTLGCNSKENCETHCSDEANYAACHDFAVGQKVPGGYTIDPQEEAVLAAAATVLGCDSYATCLELCADPANAGSCSSFADQVGLHGGEETTGPGGCTAEESCDLYCHDPGNFSECAAFVPDAGVFRGPGGCEDMSACRAYCEENPSECRTYTPGSNGVYVPVTCQAGEEVGPGGACTESEVMNEAGECAQGGQYWNGATCSATAPPGVSAVAGAAVFETREDMGGCRTPGECYDFCAANDGQCPGFDSSIPRPADTYNPHVYYTPGHEVRYEPHPEFGNCDSPGSCYDYCAANSDQCQGFDPESPRPLDVYVPGAYYTPPADVAYFTPPTIGFYVTPMYYTPAEGSNYVTPAYYTPGQYSTPAYHTPGEGSRYVTPAYYTPGRYYVTPAGEYPTPTYSTPNYYTPPRWANYSTPSYYTPPPYVTPHYATPPAGSNYTTPSYQTPPPYVSPGYHTPPGSLLGIQYSTPSYYTPPAGSNYATPSYFTPTYYTPGGYYTPTYYTPSGSREYASPVYYSPSSTYTTPTYYSPPAGSGYTTPNYPSPSYYSPSYSTPTYSTPPAGSSYTSPTYHTPYGTPTSTGVSDYLKAGAPYSYPTPSSYGTPTYGTPSTSGYATPASGSSYAYPSPSYAYPTPSSYQTPPAGYATPSYAYPTPSTYATPSSYGTPESYATPYGTPESYATPYEYPTPSEGTVYGARTSRGLWSWLSNWF